MSFSGDYMVELQIMKDGKLMNGFQFHGKLEHV